jgi:hypothetical protein
MYMWAALDKDGAKAHQLEIGRPKSASPVETQKGEGTEREGGREREREKERDGRRRRGTVGIAMEKETRQGRI